jgi:TRAP-type transport system small permease protein
MPDVPDEAAAAGGPPVAAATSLADLQAEHGGVVYLWLRRINHVLHALAGITLVLLLAWTVADIIGRSAFSRPMRGTVELTELAVVVLVYLGLAHTESDDGHITVDLLFVRLKERGQLVLRAIAGCIGVIVIAAMTWRLYVFAGQLDAGNYTTGVLRIPLYPVAILGVVGAAAFGLAVLANLAVVVRAIVKAR